MTRSMTLRPIGFEWAEEVPSLGDTDTRWHRLIWRVVDHVMGDRYLGDKVGVLIEEIKLVKHDRFWQGNTS